MTWLDWVVGAVIVVCIYRGYRKGFVQQFFDLLGSIAALILGFYFYEKTGAYLAQTFGISGPLANMVGFTLVVVGISAVVSFIGARWRAATKNNPVALVDGGVGALFGGFKAAIILLIVFLIVLATPWQLLHGPIEGSQFAENILGLAPVFYTIQEKVLPANLPRLIVSPEGVKIRRISEKDLLGATCIACGAKVELRGLVRQGLSFYPQIYCPKCHRVSDGCLTFEGYHALNGVCPYERLGTLGVTDCKVWPNPEPTRVHGKCPVCGRSQ